MRACCDGRNRDSLDNYVVMSGKEQEELQRRLQQESVLSCNDREKRTQNEGRAGDIYEVGTTCLPQEQMYELTINTIHKQLFPIPTVETEQILADSLC